MNIRSLAIAYAIASYIIECVNRYMPNLSEDKSLELGKAIVTANFDNCLRKKLKVDE